MTQAMFRQVIERQERERKEKKKKGAKKEETKTSKTGSKRDAPGKIKKNRKERRKDLAKLQKKAKL